MAPVRLAHRRQREQIGLEGGDIRVGDLGKARVREDRKIIGPVRPLALAQRVPELPIIPAADTGLRVRSDVWAVEGAERCRQRAPAGIGLAAMIAVGVAGLAIGGVG
jgi:hypothetical protein